jgi:uncharacterized protein YcfJ
MRHPALSALTLGLLASAAQAGPAVGSVVGSPTSSTQTVMARVVSSTPVVAQVATPQQVCFDELQATPPQGSGAGALLGAIAGGVIGNAVGKGAGNAVATGLGVFGGAVLGDHIEKDGRPGGQRTVRRCEQQAAYSQQVVAYQVVYELHGQTYSTQMNREPGATLPVQVSVSPVGQDAGYNPAPVYAPPPQVYNTPPVVMRAPVVVPAPVVVQRPVVIEAAYERPIHRRHWHRHERFHDRDHHRW